MIDVVDVVRDALWLVVSASVPLLVGALLGGVVSGAAGGWFGLQDTTVAAVFRAVGLLAALVVAGASIAEEIQRWTRDQWQELSALGRTEGP